jgi:hypothetical protein
MKIKLLLLTIYFFSIVACANESLKVDEEQTKVIELAIASLQSGKNGCTVSPTSAEDPDIAKILIKRSFDILEHQRKVSNAETIDDFVLVELSSKTLINLEVTTNGGECISYSYNAIVQ